MMTTQRHSLLTILPLALAAVYVLYAAVAAPARTVGQTSAQMRELNFSHSQHVEAGLECSKCHAAQTSTSGTDDLLPGHSVCVECHDVTKADNCKTCHQASSPKLSTRITSPSPIFSHERHLSKGKLKCADCHANLDSVLLAGQTAHVPRMADCLSCHTRQHVKAECRTCHLPTDDLTPADHKLDWVHAHGAVANSDESCNLCHGADHCLRCHNGDPVFNPHPRNYISRHGQDAHLSDIECSVCHDARDFCVSCHRRLNVLPAGHFKPNWVNREDGGEHATEAAFDLESCMACHDVPGQQPVCARCHAK
jgi:hypothetical protein